MTTIAADKSSIACDLQGTYLGSTKFKMKTKIITLEGELAQKMFKVDKAHIGFAGNIDAWGQVIEWYFDNPFENDAPRCKNIEFLMLTDKKKLFHSTNLKYWMLLKEPHFAIGSGYSYALAAMDAGKTPKEAVTIAAKHDVGTGLGCRVYNI